MEETEAVEVYKTRNFSQGQMTKWEYWAYSPNRKIPNRSERNLEEIANLIFKAFDTKEAIPIISRCPQFDNKIGSQNSYVTIYKTHAIQYQQLDSEELMELTKIISKKVGF